MDKMTIDFVLLQEEFRSIIGLHLMTSDMIRPDVTGKEMRVRAVKITDMLLDIVARQVGAG